jgi:hypothetical protein
VCRWPVISLSQMSDERRENSDHWIWIETRGSPGLGLDLRGVAFFVLSEHCQKLSSRSVAGYLRRGRKQARDSSRPKGGYHTNGSPALSIVKEERSRAE